MSTRFYTNWPLQPGPVTLEGPEAHHLTSVCRLRPGDAVCLFNGDGHEYSGRIASALRRSVIVEIESVATPQRELTCAIEVAAPLPKGDRGQFLIEKLTELGVSTFVPLECQRSVVQPREAKLEKLQRYVIEASKQCGRNVLMRIAAPAPWAEYAAGPASPGELRWLAAPGAPEAAGCGASQPQSIRIVVGPEGGMTDAEVATGREQGWQLIGLGPRILRIETAALAMVCMAHAVGGRG